MPNYTRVKQELVNYIYARTPLVIIHTKERQRVERMLSEITDQASQISFLYYTDAKQVKTIGSKAENVDTEDDPLGFFLGRIRRQRNLNIVMGDVRKISDDNAYSRELMNILYIAKENNGVIMLVTADPVWTRISGFGMVVTLDLPDMSERVDQIRRFLRVYGGRFPVEWSDDDIVRVSEILRGFTEIQIDNILSSEIIGSHGLFRNRIAQLTAQKQKIYPSVGAAQYVNLYQTYTAAGMDMLKEWLEEKKKIFFMPEDFLQAYDLKAPKGILMVGVPGCGKSLTAKIVAQQWDLPLLRFDMGMVYDKWVGESEKRMQEALQFIENVSPCVLWIDEIEKALAATDAGSETGKRVLGAFLFWMQESSDKVFMVATANDVRALPYELYRKGRFSEVFYAGLPDARERRSALRHYIHVSLKAELSEAALDELTENTEGYSYSDLETAVKEVAQKMLLRNERTISAAELLASVRAVIPISQMNPELVKEIDSWGRERAINVSKPNRRDFL